MKSLLLLLALPGLVLVAGCATDGTGAEAPDAHVPDTMVAFVFDWDPGMVIEVTTTRTRTRRGVQDSSQSMTTRFDLHVDDAPDELLVRFENLQLDMGGETLPAAVAGPAVAQLGDLAPDYRVSLYGEFVGLYDIEGVRSRLSAMLLEIIPEESRSEMGGILDMLTSEEFLNAKAAEQWNVIVGSWLDAELLLGEAYGTEIREPVPILPNTEITMNYTFAVRELVSCERGGELRECAQVQIHSVADPDDTARMIEQFIAKLAGDIPDQPVITALDVENTVDVLTEPDGLIPHHVRMVKHLRTTIRVGEEEVGLEQIDETESSYVYP